MEKIKKYFKNKYNIMIILLFILAFILRIVYINKIDYFENQHDIEPNGNGLAYINTIYNEHKLPDSNMGQFYHPPFHQILCSIWIVIVSNFINNDIAIYESLQVLTTIYSMLLWMGIYKFITEIKLSKKIKIFIMSVITLNPTLIILAGSINNDGLCLTLLVWTMYYLLKWFKNTKDSKNILLLAIFTGLSVMTKTSGGLIALPITYVFIVRFVKDIKLSKNKKQTLLKYFWMFLFFGCLSLSIGLWFNVRNLIKFDQPLLYVMDPNNADLYNGNYSFIERFLSFDFKQITIMYCDPWTDYNIPSYLIKCSLFGEFSFKTNLSLIYIIAISFNIINALISFTLIFSKSLEKNKRYIISRISLFILLISNIIAYLKANISLPYGCTMDFRYLIYALISSIVLIGIDLDLLVREKPKLGKIIFIIFVFVTLIVNVLADILILF